MAGEPRRGNQSEEFALSFDGPASTIDAHNVSQLPATEVEWARLSDVNNRSSAARQVLQHREKFVALVPMLARELHEFFHLGHYHAPLGSPDDSN